MTTGYLFTSVSDPLFPQVTVSSAFGHKIPSYDPLLPTLVRTSSFVLCRSVLVEEKTRGRPET